MATLAFAIFVGLGAVSFVGSTVIPASDGLRYGFPAYYTSSRLALEGDWGPDVYDNAWFSDRSREMTGGEVAEIYRPNTADDVAPRAPGRVDRHRQGAPSLARRWTWR